MQQISSYPVCIMINNTGAFLYRFHSYEQISLILPLVIFKPSLYLELVKRFGKLVCRVDLEGVGQRRGNKLVSGFSLGSSSHTSHLVVQCASRFSKVLKLTNKSISISYLSHP